MWVKKVFDNKRFEMAPARRVDICMSIGAPGGGGHQYFLSNGQSIFIYSIYRSAISCTKCMDLLYAMIHKNIYAGKKHVLRFL